MRVFGSLLFFIDYFRMTTMIQLLLVGTFLGTLLQVANACSCYPYPPPVQTTYCRSDFVVKLHVLNETETTSSDDMGTIYEYTVDVIKVYR